MGCNLGQRSGGNGDCWVVAAAAADHDVIFGGDDIGCRAQLAEAREPEVQQSRPTKNLHLPRLLHDLQRLCMSHDHW